MREKEGKEIRFKEKERKQKMEVFSEAQQKM